MVSTGISPSTRALKGKERSRDSVEGKIKASTSFFKLTSRVVK